MTKFIFNLAVLLLLGMLVGLVADTHDDLMFLILGYILSIINSFLWEDFIND